MCRTATGVGRRDRPRESRVARHPLALPQCKYKVTNSTEHKSSDNSFHICHFSLSTAAVQVCEPRTINCACGLWPCSACTSCVVAYTVYTLARRVVSTVHVLSAATANTLGECASAPASATPIMHHVSITNLALPQPATMHGPATKTLGQRHHPRFLPVDPRLSPLFRSTWRSCGMPGGIAPSVVGRPQKTQ